jgi:CrcB protein
MNVLVWVGVMGIGGLGAVSRFMVDRAVSRRTKGPFPFGTLVVNISGALMLGFLSRLIGGPIVTDLVALLAGSAFLGAYSTFSTWMLETQRLAEERRIWPAAANIIVSVILGLAAVVAGQWLASLL